MTRLPVPASGSYRRMGEALFNAGPVLAVPCPGGGRGMPIIFFTRTGLIFLDFFVFDAATCAGLFLWRLEGGLITASTIIASPLRLGLCSS